MGGPWEAGGDDPPYCGGADQPFQYNGNKQLVCAWDHRDGQNAHWDLRFSLFYDARQRMTDYEVFAIESATGPGQHAYPHNQVYSSHSVKHEFADASGKYQVTYSRQLQADLVFGEPPPDPVARTFTTRYQSDAAGRLSSVERDGKITSYQYKDSTVLPYPSGETRGVCVIGCRWIVLGVFSSKGFAGGRGEGNRVDPSA